MRSAEISTDEADIASLLLTRFPPATATEAKQRRDLLLEIGGDALAIGLLDILEPEDQRVVRPLAQHPEFDRREFRDRLVGMLGMMAGQQTEDGMFWLDA